MRTARQSARPSLVEVLFGAYRRRILSLLLLHPEETFYVREIARLTDAPAGSLHRELTTLTATGLLIRSVAGNNVRYQADRTCPIFEDLAAIFRKTTGVRDVLRDALKPLASHITVALVFGSVAQGIERAGSDVDVLVVGDASFPAVVEALNPTETGLRRAVNPVVMKTAHFRAKRRQGDRFVTRILREPKLLLMGDAGELGEPAEDRPDQGASTRRGGNPEAARRGPAESRRRTRS